jgi:hypothetical protein
MSTGLTILCKVIIWAGIGVSSIIGLASYHNQPVKFHQFIIASVLGPVIPITFIFFIAVDKVNTCIYNCNPDLDEM